MWKYVKPYLHFAVLAVICMVGEVLADLAQPTLMSRVVDEGVLGSDGLGTIISLGLAMIGVAVLGGLGGSANCAFANLCIQNVGNRLRKDCFARIMAFSVAQVERFGAGTLITRTTNDINQVTMMVQTLIRGAVRTGMLMFGSIACVYTLNPSFGIVMLACFPVALAAMVITLHKVMPLYSRIQKAVDSLNAIMQEDLNGIRIIKACVRETREKLRFGKANAELVKTQLKALVVFAFLNPTMSMLMYAAIGAMLAMGHAETSAGAASAGIIIASLTYVTQLLNSMLGLIMISQDLSRGSVSWRRLREILDTEPDLVDGAYPSEGAAGENTADAGASEQGMETFEDAGCREMVRKDASHIARPPSGGSAKARGDAETPQGVGRTGGAHLEFRRVSFSYPESKCKALDEVSFVVEPGQTVGIMGTTGCGKSTLAALSARLFDVDEGAVLVDGVDVRDWRQSALRSRVALALQRTELFSMPVGDVIMWAAPEEGAASGEGAPMGDALQGEALEASGKDALSQGEASAAQLAVKQPVAAQPVATQPAKPRIGAEEAARIAQAAEFIQAMPQGFDTVLAERGMSLSGGQRQRVSLARAIAQNAGLIVFDDATSALDLRTEADFYAGLQEACPQVTKVIIAQRIASVRGADKIIVLEAGRVVGCGTHEELLRDCAAYRDICHSQFGAGEEACSGSPVATGSSAAARVSGAAASTVATVVAEAGEAAAAMADAPDSAEFPSASTTPSAGAADAAAFAAVLSPASFAPAAPARENPPARAFPGPRRRPPMGSVPEKAKDLRYTLSRALKYFAAEKNLTIAVMVAVVASVVFGCLAPSLQSTVVDIAAGQSDARFAPALALMLGAYLLYAACQLGETWLSAHLSQRIVKRLRDELFGKVMDLPVRYLDEHSHGDMMSRMTNDVETISQTISKSLASLLSSVLTVVGTAAVMLWMCWQLALLSFSTVVLTVVATRFISRRVLKYSRQRQRLLGCLNGTVEEMVGGFRTVVVCNRQEKTVQGFDETSDAFMSASLRAQILSGVMGPVMNCISNVGFVVIAIFGGLFSYSGLITVGVISAFIVYVRQFSRPINSLAQLYGELQTAVACAERVFTVLDQESEDMVGDPPVRMAGASIEFRGVTFGYDAERPVLRDFDLVVPPGKKVALVGATGSGKTTVVNLLERFYDVDGGCILVNGQDIATVARGGLRQDMAIVLQDTMLFTDTVENNLRFANENATPDEIARALELARADKLVEALPQGLDTVLAHAGESLSQGQRQLLSIARAFVADAQILILDEATSNVDTRTEKAVQDAMANIMRGRTCIIIAHRLSTIHDADLIVVLENGRIAESGTHTQLLAAHGTYYRLHQTQFEGFAT